MYLKRKPQARDNPLVVWVGHLRVGSQGENSIPIVFHKFAVVTKSSGRLTNHSDTMTRGLEGVKGCAGAPAR